MKQGPADTSAVKSKPVATGGSKLQLDALLGKEMTRKEFLAFSALAIASVFGVVGLVKTLLSHAATPTASFEPESGTKTGSLTTVSDAGASGGSAVQFTATQTLNLWHSPQPTDSLIATYPELKPIHDQPHATWVGDWDSNPQQTVSGFASSAAGKTMVIALYAIPRDGYSAGGIPDPTNYLTWINGVKAGAGTAPVWYVLEPDALALSAGLAADAKAQLQNTLSQAVTTLKQSPNARVYIDMGSWVGANEAADLLIGANVAACEGFSINVSAFNTTTDMHSYGNQVVAALASKGQPNKKYVIDTSRNGNGPLTSAFGAAATPWLNANKTWCNPPGRGLGLSPRIPAGQPNCAALLWIKNPGGSDGNDPGSTFFSNYFGENAPGAGTFWVKWAQDCVAHTDMSNLA